MSVWELIAIGVGLSMDAFAVSVCKGLSIRKLRFGAALTVGLYFGIFQAGMPLLGYLLGSRFAGSIEHYDHWIAFGLLAAIGGKMIWDSFTGDECDGECGTERGASLRFRVMLPLAVATSIDALAVGVTFAFLKVQILPAVTLIGVITLAISMAGVWVGHIFGLRFQSKAELAGGAVLILMGLKILLEHLGVLKI